MKGKSGNRLLLCPRCEQNELHEPIESNAISEIDKKSWICHTCGRMEGIMMFWRHKERLDRIPKKEFEIEKRFKMRLGIG